MQRQLFPMVALLCTYDVHYANIINVFNMQLLKTLKNPKLFVSDWLSAVSVLLGLPKHYQPIVGVVGAAVVDVGGVGIGCAVVVSFDG